jgi:hypothetical protein
MVPQMPRRCTQIRAPEDPASAPRGSCPNAQTDCAARLSLKCESTNQAPLLGVMEIRGRVRLGGGERGKRPQPPSWNARSSGYLLFSQSLLNLYSYSSSIFELEVRSGLRFGKTRIDKSIKPTHQPGASPQSNQNSTTTTRTSRERANERRGKGHNLESETRVRAVTISFPRNRS